MNITLLAINWSQVGLQAAYLIFSLSILVILHEFGHYITARWFKCRVEKFYLFFDPWFSVVKKKIGETEYGIGWLPLGGYVKIAGMVDESMDKEALSKPAQPWEFRSKPAWQRLIIMLAGIIMNILLAFFIYAMILFTWGEKKTPLANVKDGISITDSLMYDLHFQNGDKILAVNDKPVLFYEDVIIKLLVGERVKIERDGKDTVINLPVNLIGKLVEKKRSGIPLFVERVPIIIDSVKDSSGARLAGLKRYDQVLAIDSVEVPFYDQFIKVMPSKKNQIVQLKIRRDNQDTTIPVQIAADGTLGIYHYVSPDDLDSLGLIKMVKTEYGFLESFPAGIKLAGEKLQLYIDQFKKILSPKTEAYKGLGGFKSMASIFPKSGWDWQAFWNITAFFSIILAFMNLLPIPALDGGHVLFTLIEMVTGRKPSDKFLEYAQIAGMVFLLALMLFANGNDWFGWGRSK